MRLALLICLLGWAASGAVRFTVEPTLTPNPNPRAPLAAVLRYTLSGKASAEIVVSDGQNSSTLRYDARRDPSLGLPVAGFRPGRRHTVELRVGGLSRTLRFQAPELPTGFGDFPPIRVTAPRPGHMEPGFTLISVRRQAPPAAAAPAEFSTRFGMLVALDAEGVPVWYYRSDARISDFERLPAGNILICTLDFEILEIDLLGNTIQRWYAAGRPAGKGDGTPVGTMTFHHEIDPLPGGDIAVLGTSMREIPNYYTSETDGGAPRKTQKVMGDQVVVFRRDGRVKWKWDAFDHLDPMRIGYETFSGYWERRGFPGVLDWSHANNLVYDLRDRSFLVSFRYQSAILKIDYPSGKVRWALGRPEKWGPAFANKLFTPGPGLRWFHHQHAPFPTPMGTLIVFDNGNYQTMPFDPPLDPARTYSRAVEYRLDEKTRRVEEVWTSETGPGPESVISVAMGNADRLPVTGNVLVSYGALLDPAHIPKVWNSTGGNWSRVREYTHTSPADLVWEAVLRNPDPSRPLGWQSFCAARWRALQP